MLHPNLTAQLRTRAAAVLLSASNALVDIALSPDVTQLRSLVCAAAAGSVLCCSAVSPLLHACLPSIVDLLWTRHARVSIVVPYVQTATWYSTLSQYCRCVIRVDGGVHTLVSSQLSPPKLPRPTPPLVAMLVDFTAPRPSHPIVLSVAFDQYLPFTWPMIHCGDAICDLLSQARYQSAYDVTEFRRATAAWPGQGELADLFGCMQSGFSVGFSGARGQAVEGHNLPSLLGHEPAARETFMSEVACGWKLGPFSRPPFPNELCAHQPWVAPVGTVPKHKWTPDDGAVRYIYHMSWPVGDSINDYCTTSAPEEDYFSIAEFERLLYEAGAHSLIAHCDVEHAYRNNVIAFGDLHLQCHCIGAEYFVDTRSLFGGRGSGFDWGRVALLFERIVRSCGVPRLHHYVDNFVNVTPLRSTEAAGSASQLEHARQEAEIVLMTAARLGVPMHDITSPSTSVTFLGWIFDTSSFRISISPERYTQLLSLVNEWHARATCTVHELMSVTGRLRHACCVVREGIAFLGYLIRLTRRHRSRHAVVVLDRRAHAGFAWWCRFLPLFRSRRICDTTWLHGPHQRIVCDACKRGFAAYNITRQLYFFGEWPAGVLLAAQRTITISMPFLEGLSLALAQRAWIMDLTNKRVEIVSDCEPFVNAARRQHSRDDGMLDVLQALAMMRAVHNVSVRYVHVSSEDNVVDELSRGDEQAFLHRCAGAAPSKITAPSWAAGSWHSVLEPYWMIR